MTLTTIKANSEDFGAEQAYLTTQLSAYNSVEAHSAAEDITEMFLTEARAELLLQLPAVVRWPIEWVGYTISLARALDGPAWRYLISRKQLELFFQWLGGGETSLNETLRRKYEKQWVTALSGIAATINGSGGTSTSNTTTIRL